MKRIILTKHLKDRQRERHFTFQEIKEALRDPEWQGTTSDGLRCVHRHFEERRLRVVYAEERRVIIVVSAYWLD